VREVGDMFIRTLVVGVAHTVLCRCDVLCGQKCLAVEVIFGNANGV
jgi:hypothetical protein